MSNIETKLLTNNPCYKAGRTIDVKGLVLHSVGCPQPDPLVFIKSWNKSSYDRACVHGFIGENKTYITLPVMETPGKAHRGWHAASGKNGSANNTHIGVEMCEPACIKYTGGSGFTCSNKAQAIAYVEKTTRNAVELFAMLCVYHKLNPLEDGVILSHAEAYKRGIASNHGDPDHLWRQLGMDYNMDKFRADVAALMQGETKDEEPEPATLYRVQVGAFKSKANADKQLEKVKAAGFDTYMVQVDGLYKIQTGAYAKKANAEAQLKKVTAAGFDAFITTTSGEAVPSGKKTVDEIAREVINGKWGNGSARKKALEAAGYDYSAVQKRVNELLRK